MSSTSDERERRADGTLDIPQRAIDRRLMAQLIARYGEPPTRRQPTAAEREIQELIERRDRVLADADPDLLDHLERHNQNAERLDGSRKLDPNLARAGTSPAMSKFNLDSWKLSQASEPREIEPALDIDDVLRERSPQALLRDLHRPVRAYGEVQLVPSKIPTGLSQLLRVQQAVRAAIATRPQGAGAIETATQLGFAAMAELADILAEPWENSRPENPLPLAGASPGAEDWKWFGLSGGYDPDV